MKNYMNLAVKESKKSLLSDDVPVGAVIVENNKVISKAHNTKEKTKMVTRHAEINAIEKACKKKKNWYLNDCEMYVTLEPCSMCMGAIKHARIKKVYYAVKRDKHVSRETLIEHLDEYEFISQKLLKDFFIKKRK